MLIGYFQTMAYTPSIEDSYDNVYLLDSSVSFGVASNTSVSALLAFTFLAGVVFYMVGKRLLVKVFVK
ncbi:hypothetical protein [Litchfieldia alkalitelluris]|uniref:hypothetical protein n=1 Tax=Litchfieldia alkalitelluris TaxID=304268 RepID=UPI001958EA7C|nr:hypothetical protein [Litchfieldia alkalitelluris]